MKIELTEDYGISKKGTVLNVTGVHASSLIRKKVAKKHEEKKVKEVKPKEEK